MKSILFTVVIAFCGFVAWDNQENIPVVSDYKKNVAHFAPTDLVDNVWMKSI